MQTARRDKVIPSIGIWHYVLTFVVMATLIVLVAVGYVSMVQTFERHHVDEMSKARIAHIANGLDELLDDYQNISRVLLVRQAQTLGRHGADGAGERMARAFTLFRESILPDLQGGICVYQGQCVFSEGITLAETASATNHPLLVAASAAKGAPVFAQDKNQQGQELLWIACADTNRQTAIALAVTMDRIHETVAAAFGGDEGETCICLLDDQERLIHRETTSESSNCFNLEDYGHWSCFVQPLKGGWKVRVCSDTRYFNADMRRGLLMLAGLLFSLLVITSTFMVFVFVRVSQTQRRLLAELKRADAAERAQGDFFASVSHDIRTPLNSILGFAELLRKESDAPTRQTYLDNIAFSGNMLLHLLNDVLVLSRLGSGQAAPVRDFVDPVREVRLAMSAFELKAREKGLALKLEVGELPLLFVDGRRADQVFFNLVSNALKYTDQGGVTVRFSFTPAAEGSVGTLRLEVQDTGIGIAPEDCTHLMDPYVRIHAENARGGTGLGLAICQRLVTAAGGRISLASTPGKGSTFTVTVPNVRWKERTSPAPATADAPREEVRVDLSRLRILIVDDLEMNREVLAAHCRALGVKTVDKAASGQEALDMLAVSQDGYDAVLADKKMPGMDGYALIAAIHGQESFRDLPVFIVTADVSACADARQQGARGILLKPFNRQSLAKILSSVST